MIPARLRLRLSLATLAAILRDMRRHGMEGSVAWRGVLRQVRRYADELRRADAGAKTWGRSVAKRREELTGFEMVERPPFLPPFTALFRSLA